MNYKDNVVVPKEFFKKEILEYTDWRGALIREVFQNSFDANANNLYINIDDEGASFEDDGKGMTSEVIKDGFLTLSGSIKEEGSVGGFGKAKVLICFAHNRYEIHTKDNYVTGEGGSYNLKKTQDYKNGTKISIWWEGDESISLWKGVVRRFVSILRTKRNVNVFFNNELFETPKEKPLRYSLDTEIGKVQFDLETELLSHRFIVYSKGIPMFYQSLYRGSSTGKFLQGELHFNKSHESLTANRDGLKYEHSKQLSRVIDLVLDRLDSIQKSAELELVINAHHEEPPSEENNNQGAVASAVNQKEIKVENHNTAKEASPNYLVYQNPKAEKLLEKLGKFKKPIESVSLYKSGWKFPKNFQLKSCSKTRNKALHMVSLKKGCKLALVWDLIVRSALSIPKLRDKIGVVKKGREYYCSGMKINTGFFFQKEPIQACLENDRNVLLNPIYTADKSYEYLVDLCLHELTHFLVPSHNADFCAIELQLRGIYRNNSIRKINPLIKEKVDC